MAFLPNSALALMMVLTPALGIAIPLPPLTSSPSQTSSSVGGPQRPQQILPSGGSPSLGNARVHGPRYSTASLPRG